MLNHMIIVFYLFFFFSSRRRHTRCSRDWSSDVCSSDLFIDAQVGGSLAILGGREPDDGARGRAGLLTARATALALFLCHATQRRYDAKVLSALYLDDHGNVEAERGGVFGRPGEVFSPVPFEPDFDNRRQLTSRLAHPWKGTSPRGV